MAVGRDFFSPFGDCDVDFGFGETGEEDRPLLTAGLLDCDGCEGGPSLERDLSLFGSSLGGFPPGGSLGVCGSSRERDLSRYSGFTRGGGEGNLSRGTGVGLGTCGCGGSLGTSRDRDRSRGTSTTTVSGSP